MLCPLCSGKLIPMGHLGKVMWSRCRDCGAEVSTNGEVIEEEDPLEWSRNHGVEEF